MLGTATQAGDAAMLEGLRAAAARRGDAGVVVLTDPDVAGRQARNTLDDRLGGCWHAFIPVPLARARAAVRAKEAGDIGVEHAAAAAIRRSLGAARRSDAARAAFTREALQDLGLVAVMQERVSGRGLRGLCWAAPRRRRGCRLSSRAFAAPCCREGR